MTLSEVLLSGGASVAIIGIIGKYLEFRWTTKSKKNTTTNTINAIARIYRAMSIVVNETICERFIIFKVENGGGAPKVGAHIYISSLMESFKPPITSSVDDYQRLRADAFYILMLSNIIAQGSMNFEVNKMEDSLLKSIYEASNIKYASVYHLHTTENAIYYCSLATTDPDGYESASDKLKIKLAVNEIIELFKKNI